MFGTPSNTKDLTAHQVSPVMAVDILFTFVHNVIGKENWL